MVGESLAWARGWFNGWVLLLLFLLSREIEHGPAPVHEGAR